MPKITPFLMFNGRLGEAVDFYSSIFKDSKITSTNGGGGKVMSATFELGGQKFLAYDGGPHFKFSEAISLFVSVETQEEVDEYWEQLSAGGEKSRCGWLKDQFGVSWQVIPTALMQLMSGPDPVKSQRVVQAMMQMSKIVIADLQAAYDQQ